MKSKFPARTGPAPISADDAPKLPRVRKPRTTKIALPTAAVTIPVSADLVARRAYELFLADGAQHGHDVEHWLAAERELADGVS